MPDAASLSVLRDVAMLTWLALAVGVVVFRAWRLVAPVEEVGPVRGSRVDARPFAAVDGVVVAVLLMILLFGLNGGAGEAGAAQASAVEQLTVNVLVMNAMFMLSLWALLLVYLRMFRGLDLAELFGLRRLSVGLAVGVGLVLAVGTVVVVNALAYGVNVWLEGFWTGLEPQKTVQAFRDSEQVGVRVMMVVFAVFVAPLVEETVFRGFVYPVFKKFTAGAYAAVCSSLVFGLVHLHVASLVPLVLLAMILCYVYERTGSLLVPMVIHAGFNATSLAGLLLLEDLQP